jgi:hypothetical protein
MLPLIVLFKKEKKLLIDARTGLEGQQIKEIFIGQKTNQK